jgi:glycosyltransferase involved in cell wall biosynthesis
MIRVSTILPVYNAAAYVCQAVTSLLAEMGPEDEIIAIDDGSADGSAEALASLNEPRLRLFRQDNQGAALARNQGLAQAQGRFIAFLDADDRALPGRLSRPLAAFQADPRLVIAGGGCQIIGPDGSILRKQRNPAGDTELKWRTLFNSPFTASTVTIRAEAAGDLRFDPAAVPAEDYGFFADMMDRGEGVILGEALAQYRLHLGQVTKRREEALRAGGNLVSARKIRERLGADLPESMIFLLRHLHSFGLEKLAPDQMALAAPAQATLWQLFARFRKLPGLDPAALGEIEDGLKRSLFP